MSSPALVQLRAVHRSFGRTHVLEGVDLDAHAGEVLALVGPNGGGKSTALLIMAGLLAPTSGTALVDGIEAGELATKRSGTVGLITAEAGVYPLLTGWENLDFFGSLFRLARAETRARATPLLDRLGLLAHMDRRAGTWSSGMKQKLSLVRARLLNPKLLLLDEPTANLDPLSAHTLHEAIRDEAERGLAVVVVTHDLVAVQSLCDRVAILDKRVRHVEALPGERVPPTPSRLLELFETHAGSG